MAHFIAPTSGNIDADYQVDSRMAPGSIGRMIIPPGGEAEIILGWCPDSLKVRSNNPNVVANPIPERPYPQAGGRTLTIKPIAETGGAYIDFGVLKNDGWSWEPGSPWPGSLLVNVDRVLRRVPPGYARIAPPVVSQGNARLCWAAALQSWLGATVNDYGEEQGVWSGPTAKNNKFDGLPWTRRVYSLQDMINLWGDQLHKDKSQTPEGIRILALDVGMDADLVMPSAFTTADITRRLQHNGHLYVVYFSRTSHHAVVVYGVGPDGIKVMDPLPTEGLKTRPHEFFREPQRANRLMLVGWAVRGAPLGTDPQAPKTGPSGPTGPSAAQKLYYATVLVPLWRGQLDEVGRLAREYRVHLLALECLRRAKGTGIDSVKVSEFCRKWKFPLATPFISPTALLKELLKKGIGLSGVGTVFDITGAIGKGVKIMAEMGPLLEKLQMKSALLFAFEDSVVPAADQTDVGEIIESSPTPKALFDKAKTSKDRLEAKWREVTDQADKMEAIRIEQGLPEERG